MSEYTMAQAKRDFERGYIIGANVVRSFTPGIWNVWLKAEGVGGNGYLVDARRGEMREFRSLDSAVAALEGVGVKVEGLMVIG